MCILFSNKFLKSKIKSKISIQPLPNHKLKLNTGLQKKELGTKSVPLNGSLHFVQLKPSVRFSYDLLTYHKWCIRHNTLAGKSWKSHLFWLTLSPGNLQWLPHMSCSKKKNTNQSLAVIGSHCNLETNLPKTGEICEAFRSLYYTKGQRLLIR